MTGSMRTSVTDRQTDIYGAGFIEHVGGSKNQSIYQISGKVTLNAKIIRIWGLNKWFKML